MLVFNLHAHYSQLKKKRKHLHFFNSFNEAFKPKMV